MFLETLSPSRNGSALRTASTSIPWYPKNSMYAIRLRAYKDVASANTRSGVRQCIGYLNSYEPRGRTALPARKIRRIIRAALAGILRRQRVGAERPRPLILPRDNLAGRGSLFYPAFHGRGHIEDVRAGTAAAVLHARRHVEAYEAIH